MLKEDQETYTEARVESDSDFSSRAKPRDPPRKVKELVCILVHVYICTYNYIAIKLRSEPKKLLGGGA